MNSNGFSLETEVLKFDNSSILIKATVKNVDGRIMSTGLAYEEKEASNINQTSFVENAETSAWGRALAGLGIGIDTSVASSDEVDTAVRRQASMPARNPQPQAHVQRQVQQTNQVIFDNNLGIEVAIGQMINIGGADYKLFYNREKNSYYYAIVDRNLINQGFKQYLNPAI